MRGLAAIASMPVRLTHTNMKPEENKDIFEMVQEQIEDQLKDAKAWFGSWAAVKELIDDLEDREKEKAYENP